MVLGGHVHGPAICHDVGHLLPVATRLALSDNDLSCHGVVRRIVSIEYANRVWAASRYTLSFPFPVVRNWAQKLEMKRYTYGM